MPSARNVLLGGTAASVLIVLGMLVQHFIVDAAHRPPKVYMLGTESWKIPECKDVESYLGIRIRKPTIAYKLQIDALDVKSLNGKFMKKSANANGDDEESGSSESDPDPSDTADQTKWDFSLGLKAPTGTDPSYESVLIKVASIDPDVSLRTDKYAIRAGDDNGRNMFCDLRVRGDGTVVFKAFFYRENGKKKTYGSFNIGLIVSDPNTKKHKTPIFIDPNVKNNG